MKNLVCISLLLFAYHTHAQKSDFKGINFKKADSIALAYKGEEVTNLPKLAYQLTEGLETDVERFRAIYKWVCDNIANDYSLYLKNKRKRERFKADSLKLSSWNNKFRKALFKTLVKKKRTICTGYAYLVQELAEFADLECEIVQGYGRVSTTDIDNLALPNHSWNVIKLNKKWYLCDPTWASGIPNPETNRFTFQYNEGFFLANPKLFAVNHFPVEAKWTLLDSDSPSFNDFLESPILYGNAYKKLIEHNTPKVMHHDIMKLSSITFQYLLKSTIKEKDISLLINNGSSDARVKPTFLSIENKSLTIKHQFKTTGFYDVHLYIENDLISTYTVRVKS